MDDDKCREVVIIPNTKWGGEGSLGCGIGFGYLHRIPIRIATTNGSEAPNLSATGPTTITSSPNLVAAPSPLPTTTTFVSPPPIPFVPMVPPLTNTYVSMNYNPTTTALVDNLINNNPITTASTNLTEPPQSSPKAASDLQPTMHVQPANSENSVNNISASMASQLLISQESSATSANANFTNVSVSDSTQSPAHTGVFF